MRTVSGGSTYRALGLVLGLVVVTASAVTVLPPERVRAQTSTGFIEIEAFGDLWPAATVTCTGAVSDSDPEGEPVVVSLEDTNIVEVPVGDCELVWLNPSGTRTSIGVTVEADEVTWIRGSVIEFPQGAGERYRVTDQASISIWEAPFEAGDRIWVLPGLYEVELSPRTGVRGSFVAELQTLPGHLTRLEVTTVHPPHRPFAPTRAPTPSVTPAPATPAPATVRVPDVTGLSLVEAGSLARRFEMRLGVALVNTTDADPGTVVGQSPQAGSTVSAGDTLLVRVARQPRLVAVPDITLLDESDAISLLLDAGLTPGTRTSRTDAEVPAGRVISSEPIAGSLVPPDQAVAWVASEGAVAPSPTAPPTPTPAPTPRTPRVVTVPDVEGLPEEDALSLLFEAGLNPGDRSLVAETGMPAGIVVRTDPAAGVRVTLGSTVDYRVSAGPVPSAVVALVSPSPIPTASPVPSPSPIPTASLVPSPSAVPTASPVPSPSPSPSPEPTVALVTVPDVSGLDEASARAELANEGLVPGDVLLRASRPVPAGSVIRTVPAAGESVETGTSVQLVVSQGPPSSPTPSPSPVPSPTTSPIPAPSLSPAPSESTVPVTSASPGPSLLTGEALARVVESGVLRVNVAADAPPWSSLAESSEPAGFDVQVARRIARRLGVEVEFTTFPMDEVLAGAWDDRWDIAMGHLLASDERAGVLQLTQPYAWDQLRIGVSESSGFTPDDMTGLALCVAAGSPVQGWLEGTVQLVDPSGMPALPPEGSQAMPSPTDADCLDALVAGTVDGWIGSGPTVLAAQEDEPSIIVSDPLAVAPVVVATGLAGFTDTSLQLAVDGAIATFLEEGVLVRASQRFLGADHTVPPPGAEAQPPAESALPSEEVQP